MKSVSHLIETRLGLRVSKTKSRICRPYALNFLGHDIGSQGQLHLSNESEARLRKVIRQLTRRNRGVSLSQIIAELNTKVRGWLYYFRYAKMKKRLRNVVSWLQRKLRCYRLKQAKRPIGIMRFLHRAGVPKQGAWTTAVSRKGWWRKVSTPAANEAMSNKWFTQQGLIDFNKLYTDLHPT